MADRATIEIERKFILPEVPHHDILGAGVHIRQGYLAEEGDVEVRVRISSEKATLTVKAGRGVARTEVDVPITVAQAESLWTHTEARRVDKTRHRVTLDEALGHVAEVDVYAGDLAGLCVVEVEFSSEVSAAEFVPPRWFGSELTGVSGWGNAALARHGRPD